MFLSKCSIRVDKRIELLTAVQLFTSWRNIGIWKEDYPYKKAMIDFFNPYSEHKAVKLCEELIKRGFTFDAPVGFMMHFSEPPELEVVIPFSKYHISRAGGEALLREFAKALKDFYHDSNFEEFWRRHLDFYRLIEEHASANIQLEKTVKMLEDFFGIEQKGYHVVLAPLFYGNYGYAIKVDDKQILYAFLGPFRVKNGIPEFGAALFHEFAHNFVNPLTDEFLSEYRDFWALYRPIESFMEKMAYGDPSTMINEHIIRAIELKVRSPKDIQKALRNEEKKGFAYIRPIFNLLSKYDRAKYRTFREFYPEIIDLMNSIADALSTIEALRLLEFFTRYRDKIVKVPSPSKHLKLSAICSSVIQLFGIRAIVVGLFDGEKSRSYFIEYDVELKEGKIFLKSRKPVEKLFSDISELAKQGFKILYYVDLKSLYSLPYEPLHKLLKDLVERGATINVNKMALNVLENIAYGKIFPLNQFKRVLEEICGYRIVEGELNFNELVRLLLKFNCGKLSYEELVHRTQVFFEDLSKVVYWLYLVIQAVRTDAVAGSGESY